MKIYFLIKLLTVYYTCAQPSIETLIAAENDITIQTEDGELRANREGPLNFMKMYLYREYNFTENKKVFSPQINHDYSLKIVPKENGTHTYTYTRNPENDTAYETENEEDDYIAEYHNALMAMFPSMSRDYIDYGSLRYSFSSFILETPVKKDRYYILAALLLLSEGVDVRLEWKEENDRLVLNRASREDPFFSIDVSKYRREKSYKQARYDAKTAINFFIKHKNKKAIEDLCTMEEFKKADFLDSSQFLIQRSVLSFFETVEELESFIKAVYDILNDILVTEKEKNIEEVSVAAAVFNRCFVPASSKQIEYAHSVAQIIYNLHHPAFHQNVKYYLTPNVFRITKDLKFNDDVQKFLVDENYSMFLKNLLRLFCFLLFNPNTGEYSIKKFEEEVSRKSQICPLKEFFESYKNINDQVTTKICDQWYEIFQNQKERVALRPRFLKNLRPHEKPPGRFIKTANLVSDRDYMDVIKTELNEEPDVGILDMLLIISEVTGIDDIRTETSKLIDELQKKDTDIDNFCERLKKYVKEVFISLSRYQELQIHYFNVKREIREPDGKQDIFADILVYINRNSTEENEKYTVLLPLYSNDSCNKVLLQSCILSNNDAFGLVPMSIKEKKSFMSCLLTHYVNKNVLSILEFTKISNLLGATKQAIEEKPLNINRILLLTKPGYLYPQQFFLIYCISYAKEGGVDLTYNSPMMRCIFSMSANIPLGKVEARRYFLRTLVYTGIDEIVNERLKMDKDLYMKEIVHTKEGITQTISIIKDIAHTGCIQVLVDALRIATSLVKQHKRSIAAIPLHQPEIVWEIFQCVFRLETIDVANQILKNYQKQCADTTGKITNTIRFYWFLIACRRNRNRTLVNAIYDSMDIDKIAKRSGQRKHKTDIYSMVIEEFYLSFPRIYTAEEKQKVLAYIDRTEGDEKFEKLTILLDRLFWTKEQLDDYDAQEDNSDLFKKRVRIE